MNDKEDKNQTYRLMRMDGNGNRFVVAPGLSAQEAGELLGGYECRGHKQVYWIEKEKSPA